jgi:SAM-dependent methyltransferase
MVQRVERMHAGAERLPGYAGWIADHLGGRVVAFRQRLVPQILAFTDLRDLDVLDFGCGTGSSTVALWERARDCRFTALDVDPDGIEIARLRFRHHEIEDRVALRPIDPVRRVGDLPFAGGSFDFVLANGVLEHVVPFSTRAAVVGEMWRLLRPGGLLFISETPNPLWPIDRHTTGLPLLPWLPSGMAARLAVAAGRHRPGADLDARGRRGMSYFAIKRAVGDCEVLNLTVARNRLQPAGPPGGVPPSPRRRAGGFVLERVIGPPLAALGVPALALGPFIEYLCLKKRH